jgi:pyruvate formate lyase activating enzyme
MAQEAAHYQKLDDQKVRCHLCPHECAIAPGRRGLCRVRENRGGTLVSLIYAQVVSVANDPIEKKPLYHFHPGSKILSVGTWGCNFRCGFCQNWQLSQGEIEAQEVPPEALPRLARQYDSIGVAFTYNEPSIWWEYVRDGAMALREAKMKAVLVSNGYIMPEPLKEILPLVDAINIDLKAFTDTFYDEACGGHLEPVLEAAEIAAGGTHVETTTLVIPGKNDSDQELEDLATWIAGHCGPRTPAHLSAYYPNYEYDTEPTSLESLERARDLFGKHLDYVYLGNVLSETGGVTACPACGTSVVARGPRSLDRTGLTDEGRCAECGAEADIILD